MKLNIGLYAEVQDKAELVLTDEGWRQEARTRRQRIKTYSLMVHSQMVVSDLHHAVGNLIGREVVRIALPDHCTYLLPHSSQTLEEIDLTAQSRIEVEAVECLMQEPVDGPLDSLGGGDGEWHETLLALLEVAPADGILQSTGRALCWHLLLQLPTYEKLDILAREVPEDVRWSELLSRDRIWHSIYFVLLIEASVDHFRGTSVPLNPGRLLTHGLTSSVQLAGQRHY
jgi:hypothetical protein